MGSGKAKAFHEDELWQHELKNHADIRWQKNNSVGISNPNNQLAQNSHLQHRLDHTILTLHSVHGQMMGVSEWEAESLKMQTAQNSSKHKLLKCLIHSCVQNDQQWTEILVRPPVNRCIVAGIIFTLKWVCLVDIVFCTVIP